MAERSLFESSSQKLNCHVCSETFRDPVSLSCNHSFCSSCLQKHWEQTKNKNCPTCKRKSSKEYPGVNFALKELADSVAGRQKSGPSETEKGEKKVEVVCSKHPEEPKLFCKDEDRAVCPVCEPSFHQSHKLVPVEQAVSELKEQLKFVSLSCKHSFCSSCLQQFWEQAKNKNCPICKRKSSKEFPPVTFTLKELADFFPERQKSGSSEKEKGEKKVEVVCSKNPEEPRLFCKDEERAVCPVCEFSLHQSHKVVPIEQAVSELKEQLKSDLKSLQDKRDKYKQVEKSYDEVIQHSKKQLLSTERKIRAEFNKLHQFLKEEEESRLAALREEEEQKGKTISREMKMIEEQISSLSDSISAVEEDLQKHNVSFLSSYKPTQTRATDQCSVSDPQLVSGSLIDVAKHLGNLSFRVWEKMKDKVHFSPVMLDPNTASHWLYLSDDLTSVRQGDTWQQLPENPERHTKYAVVHGSEGFSSGKHSWEVEVGDHPHWDVGLVKESVDRKGEVFLSPKYGVWCLLLKNGKYTNGFSETVTVKKSLQRIRVKLDYDMGEVSFYDPEDMTHIYTHRDTFTEKLFPYLSIGKAGDAKTVDIKICQTDISLRCSGM